MIKIRITFVLVTCLLFACNHKQPKPTGTNNFGEFVSVKVTNKNMVKFLSKAHRETYQEMLGLYVELSKSDIAALDDSNAYLVGSNQYGGQQILYTPLENYLGINNKTNWDVLVTEEELSKHFQKPMLLDYIAAPADGSNKVLVFSTVGGSDYDFIFEYDMECGLDCPNLFLKDSKSLTRIRYLDKDTILYLDSKEGVENTSDRYGGAIYKWERGKGDSLVYKMPEGAYYLSSWVYTHEGASYPAFSYFNESKYHTFLSHNNKVIDTLPSGRMKYSDGHLFFELSASNANEVAGREVEYVYSVPAEKALSGQPIKPEEVVSYNDFESDLPYSDYAVTDKYLYLLHADQENTKLYAFNRTTGQPETNKPIINTGHFTQVALYNVGGLKDRIFLFESGFHEPRRISYLHDSKLGALNTLYRMQRFDLSIVTQYHEVESHDGELVPYYAVSLEGSTSSSPTMVYTYGGFGYNNYPGFGVAYYQWLKQGGKVVFPMIRGGKEKGSKWHESAKGLNKKNTFYDLYAVLKDIYSKDISAPSSTNLLGVSNGAVTAFSTIALNDIQVNKIAVSNPLADMVNFDQYGNGANWVSEFGNPKDPEVKQYLRSYSPVEDIYHNKKLPPSLIVYSGFDDRTPPIHAKRLYQQLSQQNIDELYLYDIGIGGHNTSLSKSKKAELYSLVLEFFLMSDPKPL